MVPISLPIMMFDLFPFWLKYSCTLVDFMLAFVSVFACAGVRSRGSLGLWPAEAREPEGQLYFDICVGFQVGLCNPPFLHKLSQVKVLFLIRSHRKVLIFDHRRLPQTLLHHGTASACFSFSIMFLDSFNEKSPLPLRPHLSLSSSSVFWIFLFRICSLNCWEISLFSSVFPGFKFIHSLKLASPPFWFQYWLTLYLP